jgi:uncharacterized protein
MTPSQPNESPRPWWREPMVCLVIAGPAVVVVASFVTLGLALHFPDPPLKPAALAQARSAEDEASSAAQLPAVTARNHAATAGR